MNFIGMCLFLLLIIFLYFLFLFFYSFNSKYHNYKSDCNKDGIELYETNMEIRNNLLMVYKNDTSKIITFLDSYFSKLKLGTDKYSLLSLESQKRIIIDSLFCNKLIKHLTARQVSDYKEYIKEIPIYKRKYNLPYYTEEVNYYHHGLRFCNKRILVYIYMRDIIDVGSNIGDSLVILQNYTKYKVHLYEISKRNIKKLKNTILLNNIKGDKYILYEKGLSSFIGSITISDEGHGGVGIGKYKRNEIKVNISTLDYEFLPKNIKIGFIKADIEGEGYNFLKGSKKIIKLNRPVICIAIYHNYNEYFKIRYLLEDIVEKYIYEYHQFNNCGPYSCEFDLFAYPSEIIN